MHISTNTHVIRRIAVLLVILGVFLIVLSLNKKITLRINNKTSQINTFAISVAGVIKEKNIPLHTTDKISPPLKTWLWTDKVIEIQSPIPVVTKRGEQQCSILTYNQIAGNILSECGMRLFPADIVSLDGEVINPDHVLEYKDEPQRLVISPSTELIITEGNTSYSFVTNENNLRNALKQKGIEILPSDQIQPNLRSHLQGGNLEVNISRSKEIQIVYKDQIHKVRTTAKTVGEVLAEAGLTLEGLDFSNPPENNPLPSDGKIQIHRVDEEIILEQEAKPFPIQYQPASDIEIDKQIVIQPGAYGLSVKRIRITYLDGEIVDRVLDAEWTAKEPETRIIGYGTKINIQTVNTPDGPIRYWRMIEAYASSYSPCRSGVPNKCYPNTSSGKPVQKGVIAVTLSWYRYMKGMSVYIPGYGFATIEDVGAGLPDRNWVDLGYSDDDWVGWGQNITIYFLAPPPPPQSIMWILD